MAAIAPDQLYALTQKHFGDLGPEVVDMMYQIALRESGGDPNAYNGQGMDNSHGIWQINTIAGANPDMLKYNLSDPEQNAMAAREIYDRAGPQAWSTYQGGGMNEPMSTYQARPSGGGTTNALSHDDVLAGLYASMPRATDPKYQQRSPVTGGPLYDYQYDLAEWEDLHNTVLKNIQLEDEINAGFTRMDDGTIVSQADFDRLDPAAQAQVQAKQLQQRQLVDQTWQTFYNNVGLTEFQTAQGIAEKENNQRSTNFQNSLDAIRASLDYDQTNQNAAQNKVSRSLQGMQEASSRAKFINDALTAAQGWATPNGQTSFTPGDLGGAISKIAQFGGIGASTPFLNFTGTRLVDPAALLTAQDQALGVSGPIPGYPDLLTPSSVTQTRAPNLVPLPSNPPQLLYPQQPVQAPISQPTQQPRTMSEILGVPNF